MKHLPLMEYKEFTDAWIKKHVEYLNELGKINASENNENEELCEEKRKELKEKYSKYTDIYFDPGVYTELTDEAIQVLDLENSPNARLILKKYEQNSGKKFYGNFNEEIYTFVGVAICLDDYYWLGKSDKTGKLGFFTCVGSLDFIEDNECE